METSATENNLWDPRIYAGFALGRREFGFVLMHLESAQPFAAIIRYNGSFLQPWARTDVPREVYALGEFKDILGQHSLFIALSSEGKVYYLDANSRTEKILGAGLLSPDSTGAGIVTDIACFDDELWVVGWLGQAYQKRNGDAWQRVPFEIAPPPGFRTPNLTHIAGLSPQDFYVCGTLTPNFVELDESTLQRLAATEAGQDDWEAALDAAENMDLDARKVDEGRLFHWDGSSFRQIEMPVAPTIVFRSVFSETREKVWVVGAAGTLLVGNAQRGFVSAGRFDKRQHFLSITKLRDQYILASENELWSFDGAKASRLKPPFQSAPLRPLKVQTINDVLFYFDYISGVFCFEAGKWEKIEIPKELRARRFRGLHAR